jgi:hypothetical protein
MKDISTGFGLCALGLGIAAWPVLDRLAPSAHASEAMTTASALRTTATKQTEELLEHPHTAAASTLRSTGTESPCKEGPERYWFSTVHTLDALDGAECYIVRDLPYFNDVNGDGRPEVLRVGNAMIVQGGSPDQGAALVLQEVRSEGGSTSVIQSTILRGSVVAQPVLERFPGCWTVSAYLFECLRDMDEDGDLDVVVFCTARNRDESIRGTMSFWIENTGYEKPAPPIAADINGDGRVDGADLGMLLVAWGPAN